MASTSTLKITFQQDDLNAWSEILYTSLIFIFFNYHRLKWTSLCTCIDSCKLPPELGYRPAPSSPKATQCFPLFSSPSPTMTHVNHWPSPNFCSSNFCFLYSQSCNICGTIQFICNLVRPPSLTQHNAFEILLDRCIYVKCIHFNCWRVFYSIPLFIWFCSFILSLLKTCFQFSSIRICYKSCEFLCIGISLLLVTHTEQWDCVVTLFNVCLTL